VRDKGEGVHGDDAAMLPLLVGLVSLLPIQVGGFEMVGIELIGHLKRSSASIYIGQESLPDVAAPLANRTLHYLLKRLTH
jgi:hypothetical protein